ncbi:MAG: hypothetical protein Kow0092_26140 [Deferrisomatales bacterium]
MNAAADQSAERLALYRRVARCLNRFFARWTAPRCGRCLELMRVHHRGDPRADVVLVDGLFPGCCQAGVADRWAVPGAGPRGVFPPGLCRALERERRRAGPSPGPAEYTVRERRTGREARGVGCAHLGPAGCVLGELKAPLCLTFLCDPLRAELAARAGWALVGADGDDFCGSREVLAAVATAGLAAAAVAVAGLEGRLRRLEGRLAEAAGPGQAGSGKGSSPSCSTR